MPPVTLSLSLAIVVSTMISAIYRHLPHHSNFRFQCMLTRLALLSCCIGGSLQRTLPRGAGRTIGSPIVRSGQHHNRLVLPHRQRIIAHVQREAVQCHIDRLTESQHMTHHPHDTPIIFGSSRPARMSCQQFVANIFESQLAIHKADELFSVVQFVLLQARTVETD